MEVRRLEGGKNGVDFQLPRPEKLSHVGRGTQRAATSFVYTSELQQFVGEQHISMHVAASLEMQVQGQTHASRMPLPSTFSPYQSQQRHGEAHCYEDNKLDESLQSMFPANRHVYGFILPQHPLSHLKSAVARPPRILQVFGDHMVHSRYICSLSAAMANGC